jgi:hypothetical protein
VLHAQCDALDDGCGNVIDCGVCPTDKTCGKREPNHCDK